ncbi:MAG: thioredoxin family protein [Planctomycetota bacterium]
MTTERSIRGAYAWRPLLSFGMVLVLGVMAYRTFVVGSAAMPPVFEKSPTLTEALAAQAAGGSGARPILAFATADWCGPCQLMKRSTFVEPGVVAFIRDHTTPVYVNIDKDPAAATMLSATSIPATYVIVGDRVVASFVGLLDAQTYLQNITAAVDLASHPEELEKLGDSVRRLRK